MELMVVSFNTASGKYCCNEIIIHELTHVDQLIVSIPQAVSTVATKEITKIKTDTFSFNTASGKYCCNSYATKNYLGTTTCFNTASGKYCCNI